MNITKTSNLSFYNDQGILTLTAKQFDTGRIFAFHIMDHDTPFDLSGCTAYLRIAKADGTQFQGHECCMVEGSQISINTSVGNGSQILAAAGTNICELHLKDENDVTLTAWTFHIIVEPRVHDGSHMVSIDSYDVLDNMINMEKERIANEEQRKENETHRTNVFNQKIGETNTVITDCQLVIDAANQKIHSFDEEINGIVDGITKEAQSYADNAKASEANAANAASSAAGSAASASQKASDAAASAALSQSYAVGGTQSRAGEDADNAKYYKEKAQEAFQNLQRTAVTGVKGAAESAYRTGTVNLTPANIGLGNVNDTSDENKPVSSAQRAAIDAKVSKSGDTMSGNLEMTNHSINNVSRVGGTVGDNDYWRIAGGDTGSNAGYLEIATADDGTEPIYVRQYNNGVFGNISRQLTLLDEWGNTLIPGTLIPNIANSGTIGEQNRQFRRAYIGGVGGTMAENDYWGISGKDSGVDCGYLDIATGDNGNEPIYVTQYSDGNFTHVFDSNSITHRATLLDENGNTAFPGRVTAPVFQGQVTNADVAAKLGTTSVGSSEIPIYLERGIPFRCEDILNLYHEAKNGDRENWRFILIKPTNPSGGYNFLIQFVSIRPLSIRANIRLPYSYPLSSGWRPMVFATNEIGAFEKQIMSVNFNRSNAAWTGVGYELASLDMCNPIYNEDMSNINIMVIGVI